MAWTAFASCRYPDDGIDDDHAEDDGAIHIFAQDGGHRPGHDQDHHEYLRELVEEQAEGALAAPLADGVGAETLPTQLYLGLGQAVIEIRLEKA